MDDARRSPATRSRSRSASRRPAAPAISTSRSRRIDADVLVVGLGSGAAKIGDTERERDARHAPTSSSTPTTRWISSSSQDYEANGLQLAATADGHWTVGLSRLVQRGRVHDLRPPRSIRPACPANTAAAAGTNAFAFSSTLTTQARDARGRRVGQQRCSRSGTTTTPPAPATASRAARSIRTATSPPASSRSRPTRPMSSPRRSSPTATSPSPGRVYTPTRRCAR